MRSRLLGEYREAEATAPPPQGMGASGSWDGGGRTPVVLPLLFSREPGPPSQRQAPALAAPTFSRRSGLCSPPPPPPAPIHSPPRPRPSTARRAHWHSPGPIATSLPQPRHQSVPAGGGASPMSFRLLPGPQDPFCLGRARLGLSSRHFLEEAPPPARAPGWVRAPPGSASATFHLVCGFWAARGRVFRALPSWSGTLRNGGLWVPGLVGRINVSFDPKC